MPITVSIVMGVLTGIFGGVLRDMVCNEISTSFKDHRPYALCYRPIDQAQGMPDKLVQLI